MEGTLGVRHDANGAFRRVLVSFAWILASGGLLAPGRALAAEARQVECQDFATGSTVQIFAQQLLSSGALDVTWDPAAAGLCFGSGQQRAFGSIPDGVGGAIIAWLEPTVFGGQVRAIRLDSDGAANPAWPAGGRALTATQADQYGAAIVTDGAGGGYIAWQDYRNGQSDVYLTRVLPDASTAGGWNAQGDAVAHSGADETSPQIAADGAGGVFVAWLDYGSGTSRVRLQRCGPDSSPASAWPIEGLLLGDAVTSQADVQVAADGAGGVFVVWTSSALGGPSQIQLTRVDGTGQPSPGWSPEGTAVSSAPENQRYPSVRAVTDHGAWLVWVSDANEGDVFVQRFSPSGVRSAAWPSAGVSVCAGTGQQYAPSLVADSTGDASVVWEDYRAGAHADVYAQRVSGDGVLQWGADGVAVCDEPGEQTAPRAMSVDGGRLRVTWVDDRGPARGDWLPGIDGSVTLVAVSATGDRVRLEWSAPASVVTATLFRSADGSVWQRVGTATRTADGRLAADDRTTPGAARAWYRLTITVNGESHSLPATPVDLSSQLTLALERPNPSPTRGALRVAFTLPTAAPAMLELIDIVGRRIASRAVGGMGPGRHVVELADSRGVPPGRYVLRLSQAGHALHSTVTVLR